MFKDLDYREPSILIFGEKVQQAYSLELREGARVVDGVRVLVRDAASMQVLSDEKVQRGQVTFSVNFDVNGVGNKKVRIDVFGTTPEAFEVDCDRIDDHPEVKALRDKIAAKVREASAFKSESSSLPVQSRRRYPWYNEEERGWNVLPAGEIQSRLRNLGLDPNEIFEQSLMTNRALKMQNRLRVASNGSREFEEREYWKGFGFPSARNVMESIEQSFVRAEDRGDPVPPAVEIQDQQLLNYGGIGMLMATVASLGVLEVTTDLERYTYVSDSRRFALPESNPIRSMSLGLPERLQESWNEVFPGGKMIPRGPIEAREWFRLALARFTSEANAPRGQRGVVVIPQMKHSRGKVDGTLFATERGSVAMISPASFVLHLAQMQVVNKRALPSDEVLSRTGFNALNGFSKDGGMMTADVERSRGGFKVRMGLEHPGNALGVYGHSDLATDILFKGFLSDTNRQIDEDQDAFMGGQRLRRLSVESRMLEVNKIREQGSLLRTGAAGFLLLALLSSGSDEDDG